MTALTVGAITAVGWLYAPRQALREHDIAPEGRGREPPPHLSYREVVRRDDAWLAARLAELGPTSRALLSAAEEHRVQVLVTEVVPDEGGRQVIEHGYRVDAELTFAASALKPFVAVAALRKLDGLGASLDTPLRVCARDELRCRDGADRSNVAGGLVTLGHELRKMLLVSSNLAFNRLYDFVGRDELNTTLHGLGFDSVRIRNRFQGGAEGSLSSPRMELGDDIVIPLRASTLSLGPAPALRPEVGAEHYDDTGKLQKRPADFRFKNYASLRDLHRLMLAIGDPSLPGAPALGLGEAHRAFLRAAMQEDPLASANPEYKGAQYGIERYKALLRGVRRAVPAADVVCLSKSGRAYGFELDNAYLRHLPSGRALVVTAVVHADPNQVVNDDGYAYHLTGAFMEELGTALARAAFSSPAR